VNTKKWGNMVVYQIFPQSFYDANDDGIGDIRGIIKKLPYLKELGINAIWLCPIFLSPMIDNGYDISDYYTIHPRYGSLEDFKDLLADSKKSGIQIFLDLVVNHCSIEHEWFQKALANPESDWADYFIIKKSKDGKEPNNWRSIFGGSVWERIKDTHYFYYHTFNKAQPDFNWENPALRKEIYKIISYWLEMGVSGFRIDAITFIKKDLSFQSLPADQEDGLVALRKVGINYPGIEVFLEEMKRETFDKYNAFTVAEMSSINPKNLSLYVGEGGAFDSIFDFSFMNLDLAGTTHWYNKKKFTAKEILHAYFDSQKYAVDISAYLSLALENHDQPRAIHKWVEKEDISFKSLSMIALLQFALRGIPFIYQGQEIGMQNYPWKNIDEINDIKSLGQYESALLAGKSAKEAFDAVSYRSRDNARTIMQWNKTKYGGFSKGPTAYHINKNYKKINICNLQKKKTSLWHFYKKLITLRLKSQWANVLSQGGIKQLAFESDHIIAFSRFLPCVHLVCLINYSSKKQNFPLSYEPKKIIINNYSKLSYFDDQFVLKPFQAVLFEPKLL